MTGTDLIERYRTLAVIEGNEIFLTPDDALSVVDDISQGDGAVLSIEGFDIEDGSVRPRLDLIADYSPKGEDAWPTYRASTLVAARDFLSRLTGSTSIAVVVQLWTHQDASDQAIFPTRSSLPN